jgi:hypothetical protein
MEFPADTLSLRFGCVIHAAMEIHGNTALIQ